jgi:hypothetical protein
MMALRDNLRNPHRVAVIDVNAMDWRTHCNCAGEKLDVARSAMARELAAEQPLPTEERMGDLEYRLQEALTYYRQTIEKLTGQSADDVARRLS